MSLYALKTNFNHKIVLTGGEISDVREERQIPPQSAKFARWRHKMAANDSGEISFKKVKMN